jgi:Ni2+-binding GTPase involved in maturation of urease and hydrogenase
VFVAGPRGAGKTRWIQERILALVAAQPGIRCAVVLAEDGHTRMERFAHDVPGLAVRRVLMPCPCCPARACLPETIRELQDGTGIDWLFVETPATAAAGLLGEFDRALGWSREVVLCLDEKWENLSHRPDRPPFLSALLERADRVMRSSPITGTARSTCAPDIVLT